MFLCLIWMAADVTGPLTDRYECLLWQENCCTIFLYWWWASSFKSGPIGGPAVSERRRGQWTKPPDRSFAFETNHCHFVNRETGSQGCVCSTRSCTSACDWMLIRPVIIPAGSLCKHLTPRTMLKDCCRVDHVILHHFVCAWHCLFCVLVYV